jgi:hypothetical protein
VGVHRLTFEVPDGWQHFDHGREQRFERGILQMSITDLGPVDGPAYARVIEGARELWRRGRWEDAHAVLAHLRPWEMFGSEAAWRSFRSAWNVVSRDGSPAAEVEEAYREVLSQISARPRLDLETLADAALAELGHDERRSVAGRRRVAIDGREALRVDTWDRLSHQYQSRHLFVMNEGHLLVARTELGGFSEMEGALDTLTGSLAFRPAHR